MIRLYCFFILMLALFLTGKAQEIRYSHYDSTRAMPPYRFYTLDGDTITPATRARHRYLVMIYFKNDCGFCEKQAAIIDSCAADFKKTHFLFVSQEDTTSMRSYANRTKPNPLISFGHDREQMFYRYYVANYTPSIHIYNRQGKLILFHEGLMTRRQLSRYIH